MKDEEIAEAIAKAAALTTDAPADLRQVAFRVVLESLIGGQAATPLATHVAPPTPAAARAPTSMSINELLVQARATTHVERIVVIAYHMLITTETGVTTADIVDAYSKARTQKPQNFADVIGTTIRRGYLIEGPKKDGVKAWVITPTGEQFVQDLLKGDASV